MDSRAKGRVLVEVTIGAPVETMWRALRDPEQIGNWFGWDAETLKEEIAFGAYAVEAFAGESLGGTIWHRSPFQIGVTVAQWGDGLLVVTDKPDGGGAALLTTYGLEEAAFAALGGRWSAWWGERYLASA